MNSDEFTLVILYLLVMEFHRISCKISLQLLTYKTGGVIVPDSFSVTKRLHSRVTLHDLIFKCALVIIRSTSALSSNQSEVLDNFFRIHGFTSTRFTAAIYT